MTCYITINKHAAYKRLFKISCSVDVCMCKIVTDYCTLDSSMFDLELTGDHSDNL